MNRNSQAAMNGTTEDVARDIVRPQAGTAIPRWQWVILAVVIGWLYDDILWRLVEQWWNDPDFSHGFFVPLFSAYVLWQQRDRLGLIPAVPSWLGLVVIAGGAITLVVGVLGAELFLSRSSLLLLLAGLAIYFVGWSWFRAALFPWAFLFLMVPIPKVIFNQVTFPLQFLASGLASAFLGVLGVPVLREGNVIHLAAMDLEVVEACSGIRSLLSLVTLAVIYGYFLEPRALRRVLLVLAAVPIAVVANGLRVMGTGLLGQYWSPEKAMGFFHSFSGWVIFILALALLFAFHGVLRLAGRWRGTKTP